MSKMSRPLASATTSRELERLILSTYSGGSSSAGVNVNTESAMRVAAVFTCVLILSQSVAQLPLHEFEQVSQKTKQKAIDHYLYSIVHDQPNEWMTSYEAKQLIMVHLLLRGNSVWLKTSLPSNRDNVRELIPIHPDLVEKIQQDERYRLWYKIKRPGSGVVDEIPGSRLVHFRGMSMNGFVGMNPIEYARESIGLAIATEKHGAKLFTNGARLGGILTHPNKISEPAAKRLIESFNDAHSSVENAHKTALLEEGMKWEKITMTAEDAQFLDSRKYQRSEIGGLFRVPAHMMNDLEKATFSNVEHLDIGFVKHSLTPWLTSIEQTLKKDLMTLQEKRRYYFKFSVDGILRGDIKSRFEAYSKAVTNGIYSPNEIRELEDRNPYDGGDEYRVPMNTEAPGEQINEHKTTA